MGSVSKNCSAINSVKEINDFLLKHKQDAEERGDFSAPIIKITELHFDLTSALEENKRLKSELASALARLDKINSASFRHPSY